MGSKRNGLYALLIIAVLFFDLSQCRKSGGGSRSSSHSSHSSFSRPTHYPSFPSRPTHFPSHPSFPSRPTHFPSRPSFPSYPSFPSRPSYPSRPSIPSRPSFPSYPSFPSRPTHFPSQPSFPSAPKPSVSYPSFPSRPSPSAPKLPSTNSYPSFPSHPGPSAPKPPPPGFNVGGGGTKQPVAPPKAPGYGWVDDKSSKKTKIPTSGGVKPPSKGYPTYYPSGTGGSGGHQNKYPSHYPSSPSYNNKNKDYRLPPAPSSTHIKIKNKNVNYYKPEYTGSGKTKIKVVNKYYNHYPGYYTVPRPHYYYHDYYWTPNTYRYGYHDTGHGALGFYLGYSLGRLDTPTYSHYSFYDGYRPRYDHYHIYHYDHNREMAPQTQNIESAKIIGCVGDSSEVCPFNTISLCTSNGTLMCVVNAQATVSCLQGNCVRTSLPCVNNTMLGCEKGARQTSIDLPCISNAQVYGNIRYENNTIYNNPNLQTPNENVAQSVAFTQFNQAIPMTSTTQPPIVFNDLKLNETVFNQLQNLTQFLNSPLFAQMLNLTAQVNATLVNQTLNNQFSSTNNNLFNNTNYNNLFNGTNYNNLFNNYSSLFNGTNTNNLFNGTDFFKLLNTTNVNAANPIPLNGIDVGHLNVTKMEEYFKQNPQVLLNALQNLNKQLQNQQIGNLYPTPASSATFERRTRAVSAQNFCVTIMAVPAEKPVSKGEVLYDSTKRLVSKFLAKVWGLN